MNRGTFRPSRALTPTGKLLVAVVRFLYHIRGLLGFPQWHWLLPNHHEDPAHMTLQEKLYLGYKYYFKGMTRPEKDSRLDEYFKKQHLKLQFPQDFIVEETLTLSAGGDLIPYTILTKENCEQLWDHAGDFFFNNDIVFANLETVADVSKPYSAAPEVMLHDMFFNINQQTFDIFSGNGKYKGYDVLSTANNHTLDLGADGVLSTIDFLQEKNIEYCGTANSAAARERISMIERKGIKIAFLAYTFSLNKHALPHDQLWLCNHLDLNKEDADISSIVADAARARAQGADIIVAAMHMGCAYQVYPNMHTVHNMHRICKQANIDIVLGGHPHNMQPLEILESTDAETGRIKQHFISYSQGDFIAYDIFKWCHLPLLLRLSISKGTIGGKRHVQLTGIEAKPFYLYANKQQQLQLLDFLQVLKTPEKFVHEREVLAELKELDWFFNEYIFTEKQQHVLAQ
jgi:poly-gamma-glutamate synthesis protein (capsule biosynthesis protein)